MEASGYTARVVASGDITGYIDIQPPIGTISKDFLRDFGADYNTTVDHKLTTAYTTRLSVTVNNEELSTADKLGAFKGTAAYILKVLLGTDRGLDIGGTIPDHTFVFRSSDL